jgi:hypothetical protein
MRPGAALTHQQLGVEGVNGGGAHHLARLEDATDPRRVVDHVQAGVTEIRGETHPGGAQHGARQIAAADDGIRAVAAQPAEHLRAAVRPADDEGGDDRRGVPALLLEGVGSLPLVSRAFREPVIQHQADPPVPSTPQLVPDQQQVSEIPWNDMMEMRVPGRSFDGHHGKVFPRQVKPGVGVLEGSEDQPADPAVDQNLAEPGGRGAVLSGPQVLQRVTQGTRARRGALPQGLGAGAPEPVLPARPV